MEVYIRRGKVVSLKHIQEGQVFEALGNIQYVKTGVYTDDGKAVLCVSCISGHTPIFSLKDKVKRVLLALVEK